MLIDFHAHCFAKELLPVAYHESLVAAYQAKSGSTSDPARVLDRMRNNVDDPEGVHLRTALDTCGIDHAVVIGLDWGLVFDDPVDAHPSMQLAWATSLVARHGKDRLSFVFGIDPRRSDAAELTQHAFDEGAVGVKLYPPAGFAPDDPLCDTVFEVAEENGGFVMAHTGRQTYPFDLELGRVERYGSVLRRHPGAKLILAHAGYPFWGAEAIEIVRGHPQAAVDVSGWNHLLDIDEPELRRFLERAFGELGPHRVLFGSDLVAGPRTGEEIESVRRWIDLFLGVADHLGLDYGEHTQETFSRLTR